MLQSERASLKKTSLTAFLAVFLNIVASIAYSAEVTPSQRVKESVTVRPSPSAGSGSIGELKKGERAPLLESIPHWYKIELSNGQPGFVPKAWTEIAAEDSEGVPTSGITAFKIHFLDVGTGDSAIIDMGEKEIVIDGGNFINDLHDYANKEGIIQGPIELVVVTHGDQDHWKGIMRLLNLDGQATAPRSLLEFWEPGYDRDCNASSNGTKNYLEFIEKVKGLTGVTIKRPLENFHAPSTQNSQVLPITLPTLPGVKITLLHSSASPPASNGECSYRINNASIVLKLEINGVKILFTGDANGKERNEGSPGTPGHIEKMLLDLEAQHPGLLKVDILKVPHHGSETASTQQFIDKVDPRFVIISASTTHHLPKSTTVARYDNGQRVILRTDKSTERGKDHIICGSVTAGDVQCNFKNVLEDH